MNIHMCKEILYFKVINNLKLLLISHLIKPKMFSPIFLIFFRHVKRVINSYSCHYFITIKFVLFINFRLVRV